MEPLEQADALISLLGFPSWGPLHLRLPQGSAPALLARRLQPALSDQAGQLPALLLRGSPAPEPVLIDRPWPPCGCRLRCRYRLLWRPGPASEVRISLWRKPAWGAPWACAWPTTRLQEFTSHWGTGHGGTEHEAPPATHPSSAWDARDLGLRSSSDWRP